MTYTYGGVLESTGMWYAKRLSDEKEFLACSMTRQGGIFGVAKDGEKATLLNGTFDFYKR